MPVLAGDEVRDRDTLLLALVREHRAAHAVADRPDALRAGLAVIVDLDESARIEHDARAIGQQVLREGPAADGDDDAVDDERLAAARIRVTDVHAVLLDFRARYLRTEADVEALLLEVTQRLLGERAIRHGQELLERLQHDGLRPEPAPHAAELESDDARADDAKPLRHRVELECAPGIHDLLAVELDAAQRHRLGS